MKNSCKCKGTKMCKKCKKDYGDSLFGKCRKYINTGHGKTIGIAVAAVAIVLSFGSIATMAWTEPGTLGYTIGSDGKPTGNVSLVGWERTTVGGLDMFIKPKLINDTVFGGTKTPMLYLPTGALVSGSDFQVKDGAKIRVTRDDGQQIIINSDSGGIKVAGKEVCLSDGTNCSGGGSSSSLKNSPNILGGTSAKYNGNLGGLAGADAKCQSEYGANSRVCVRTDLDVEMPIKALGAFWVLDGTPIVNRTPCGTGVNDGSSWTTTDTYAGSGIPYVALYQLREIEQTLDMMGNPVAGTGYGEVLIKKTISAYCNQQYALMCCKK